MKNLSITKTNNANSTLRWLKRASFVDDAGVLTEGGQALLGDESGQEYKTACQQAIVSLVGEDVVHSLRAGTIGPNNLISRLQTLFKLGDSAAKKARAGLVVLAEGSGDAELVAALGSGRPRRTPSAVPREPRQRHPRPNAPRTTGASENSGPVIPMPQAPTVAEPTESNGSAPSPILSGELVRFSIDGSWKLDDIQRLLRMLQLVERGELLPEPGAP